MPIAEIQKYCGMPYEVAKVQLLKFKNTEGCRKNLQTSIFEMQT